MDRSRVVRVLVVLVLVGGVLATARWWWTRDRLVTAGNAVVLVEGHDLSLGPTSYAGVGVEGSVELIGGRCVGFADLGGSGGSGGSVIVWPPGTEVHGTGESLEITSRGVTIRIGDEIVAGSTQRSFPSLEGRLPEECDGAEVIDVDPTG